jgi:hypothetical protein
MVRRNIKTIRQDAEHLNMPLDSDLDAQERALLAIDVAWVQWRSAFRQKLVAGGDRPVRSIFEADMIFAIVAHHALKGWPVTLRQLAT